MRSRPAEHHILLTGAGSGIGLAIALRLASEGAALSLIGRREAPLTAAMEQCLARGARRVQIATVDVKDAAAVDRAADSFCHEGGPLFAAVANAGVGGPNYEGPDDRWDEILRTNLDGAYFTMRAARRHLAPGPAARHLVATSSILGRIGVGGYSAYCASKAGVLGLVRALAAELARDNVQVNAVCPGWVETDMAWTGLDGIARAVGGTREDAIRIAMKDVPLGRMGKPEHVAGMVSWLLSDDATGVTGQGLDINGGAYMQ